MVLEPTKLIQCYDTIDVEAKDAFLRYDFSKFYSLVRKHDNGHILLVRIIVSNSRSTMNNCKAFIRGFIYRIEPYMALLWSTGYYGCFLPRVLVCWGVASWATPGNTKRSKRKFIFAWSPEGLQEECDPSIIFMFPGATLWREEKGIWYENHNIDL